MTRERKILRKKYGPTYESSYWKIKTNQEIYNQFYYPGTVTVIGNALRVVRVKSERKVKKIPEGKSRGGRKKEDPNESERVIRIGREDCVCRKVKKKSCKQNRTDRGLCRQENQGQI